MKKIIVEGLKYKYPLSDALALNDITFAVEQGEMIGVVGKNSVGKSTLCQAIVGLVPHFYKGAYGGKVFVDGLEVKSHSIAELSLKVGMVFQNPFTQVTGSKLTVYEEIAFGLENIGIPRHEIIERIDEVITLLNIEHVKDRNPFDLSGGQMQRMAIASIIAMKPDILVLDEPTSQLDPEGSDEVFRSIQSLSKQGITVIMAEHKIEKVAQYCEKVILLKDGRIIDFDTPEKVFSRTDLEEHGVNPPVYTRVCKALGSKKEGGEFYPVTLEDAFIALKKVSNLSVGLRPEMRTQPLSKAMINVSNLSFSYEKGTPILSGINVELDQRSTAIIGQNGAGKTTFVKLLKGLLRPYDGEILIGNLDVKTSTAAEIAETVGLVFQNPNDQIFKRTLMDEVMFGPLNIRMDKEKARRNAIQALEMVGLYGKLDENPHDLSLSEKKLLCIASVVAMDTEIIILDEPTIAQDQAGKEKIKEMIKELKRKNKLVMTIIHDMDFVAENFERTIVFNEGRVILDGDTRDVFSEKELLRAAHVEAPGITQLAEKLGINKTVLTVEELIGNKKQTVIE